ncbi:MAG: Type 1 glutamine amidotransferase-like domain-containing protein [bacterium]
MKILLTSSGVNNPELEQAFSDLTNNKKDLKVALITTAADQIDWIKSELPGYDVIPKINEGRLEKNLKWQQTWKKEYEDKGFKATIVDLKKDPDWIKEELSKVDIIDVCGGDGNWLREWARVSKIDTYLKDLIEKGVVYVGTSAGAGLAVADFGLGWWTPEWKEDHTGLGLVDFCVAVHQKEGDERTSEHKIIENREKMRKIIDFPWRVYLLKDGQAIKVDGDKVEHIGPGEKRVV